MAKAAKPQVEAETATPGWFTRNKPAEPLLDAKPANAVAALEAEIKMLRADLGTNIDRQRELEQSRQKVPDALLGSRVRLEQMVASREKEIVARHGEQCEENYRQDRGEWLDLCRQRCLAVLALRRINKAIEAKYASYRSGGSAPRVPLYAGPRLPWSFGLLGTGRKTPGVTGLLANEYLREAVSEKILNAKDLESDE